MKICTGWSPPAQVYVAQSSPIIAHTLVKLEDCCANNLLRQSFLLKKSHNKSVLPG